MIGWAALWQVFGRIGLLSFGGPAAQIALMHKELVADRPWLTEAQFLRALSFCMLLPGPEAMQLATYAGWRLKGIPGGLLAGGLFVLPGALVIACLALAYVHFGDLAWVQGIFVGVQATVVVIVIAALRKLLAKVSGGVVAVGFAIAACVALYIFALPFPLVIGGAAMLGAVMLPRPEAEPVTEPDLWRIAPVVVVGGLIWAAPILTAHLMQAKFLTDLGLYFSKLAVVTFGGAYAVLAYMAQTVVQDYGWISTTQMLDGLGLAETTPGPLILVTQMVAMVAGDAQGGTGMALLAGAMALWVTFVPCFIWIFACAPFIDWLAGQSRLQAALSGITAAVVGVIANLSLWFAFHVFFGTVQTTPFGAVPDLATFQPVPFALACVAAAMILWRGWGLMPVLLVNGALSFSLAMIGAV